MSLCTLRKILCLAAILGVSNCFAQTDTAFVNESVAYARAQYSSSIRTHGHLFNGSQYVDYNPTGEEHPFFQINDWTDGAIFYDGEYYDNVSLMYDIFTDKVIVESFGGSMVQLIAEKITFFNLFGHTFRKFTRADDSRQSINDGFYDVLHDGDVKLVVRRIKWFSETVQSTDIIHEFDLKLYYYVVKNNTFFPVKSKKSILQVLGDKRTELKHFIQSNKVNFKSDREKALTRVVAHYNTLNP